MAFMSLVFIGIILLMAAVSVICLTLAVILFLVNWFRRRRGKEPKKFVRIIEIVFLVLGIMNGVPMLLTCVINGVGEVVERVQENIAERTMPERAVLYDGDAGTEYLDYKGKKYVSLGLGRGVGEEELNLSEAKAYVRSKEDGRLTGDTLYEVKSEPYDLLYDDTDHLYCKEEDADRFMEEFHATSTYYLCDDEEWMQEVQLEDLGVKLTEIEKLAPAPDSDELYEIGVEHSLTLCESGMDGKFREECTYLEGPDPEGNWYLRQDLGQWWKEDEYEVMSAVFLPEKGCRYMDSLMKKR